MEDLLLTLHFYCISLPPSTNIDPRFITRIAVVAEGVVRGGEARNIDGFVEIFKTIMDVGTDISETIINLVHVMNSLGNSLNYPTSSTQRRYQIVLSDVDITRYAVRKEQTVKIINII